MSLNPPDDLVEVRVAQLQAITARRNELLQQMYHLMRQRHNVGNVLKVDESDNEDQGMHTFLQKLDLHKHGEQAFVANHVEKILRSDELSPISSPTSESGDQDKQDAEPRGVRTRAAVAPKSPSPVSHAIVGSPVNLSDGKPSREFAHEELSLRYPPFENQAEETDDDRDELDLIGSSHSLDESDSVLFLSSKRPERKVAEPVLDDGDAGQTSSSASQNSGLVQKVEMGDSSNQRMQEKYTILVDGGGRDFSPETPSLGVMQDAEAPEPEDAAKPPSSTDGQAESAIKVSIDSISAHASTTPKPAPILGYEEHFHHVALQPQAFPISRHLPNEQMHFKPTTTVTESMIHPPMLHTSKTPIIIPTPSEPFITLDQYNVEAPPLPEQKQADQSIVPQRNAMVNYTLPPLQLLPPEFTRKKSTKRKKDRDRDNRKDKDDGLPIGVNRWAAILNANPSYRRVARSTKCLSTKEWSIAISELRLIRTVERIEALKLQGRWGFRQIKKQRGVGGLLKTHWDYVLDEMKWMRTDFREERKWKLALAFHLSTSVLEWHALNSWEERAATGICIKWKPIAQEEPIGLREPSQEILNGSEAPQIHPGEDPQQKSVLGGSYTSDEDDMDEDANETPDVIDSLDTSNAIQEALDSADEIRQDGQARASAETGAEPMQLKMEEVDDASALHSHNSGTDMVIQPDTKVEATTESEQPAGLKPSSKNPLLGSKSSSHSLNGDTDPSNSNNSKAKISAYAPMRENLVYGPADTLFVNTQDLEFLGTQGQSTEDPFGLEILFPELQPFAMLDVAPAGTEIVKKKSSKNDKDDPNKRIEETTYTKVHPMGQFMLSKPTLLGPLQPSKRWKDGRWIAMPESAVVPDSDGYIKVLEDSVSELFDLKVKISGPAIPLARDAKKPRTDQFWSSNDDILLKSLVDRYPGNWNLIAECFNGARLTTPSDRRTPNDCLDRWKTKWGSDLQGRFATTDSAQATPEDVPTPPIGVLVSGSATDTTTPAPPASTSIASAATATSQMTTRGVKRMASASVSSQLAPTNGLAGSEPKKRRRHLLLQESIRKTSKKRAEQQQKLLSNPRNKSGMHETHIQYTKMPKLTPAELSRLKAERDAQQLAEIQKARQRQEELKNQQPRLAGIPIPQAVQQLAQQPSGQPPQVPQLSQQQLQLIQQTQAAQAQANQANRTGNVPAQNARPTNVNIARISTPTTVGVASAPRLTNQQMLQLQQQVQQQQRAAAVAAANQQQVLNGVGNMANGTGAATVNPNGNHVNVPGAGFVNRDPTASPAAHGIVSPHLGVAGGGVASNSPRPHDQVQTSVPAQPGLGTAAQLSGARPVNHYYMPTNGTNYTPEQLNALRLQMLQIHQQQQQLQQQAQQAQQAHSSRDNNS